MASVPIFHRHSVLWVPSVSAVLAGDLADLRRFSGPRNGDVTAWPIDNSIAALDSGAPVRRRCRSDNKMMASPVTVNCFFRLHTDYFSLRRHIPFALLRLSSSHRPYSPWLTLGGDYLVSFYCRLSYCGCMYVQSAKDVRAKNVKILGRFFFFFMACYLIGTSNFFFSAGRGWLCDKANQTHSRKTKLQSNWSSVRRQIDELEHTDPWPLVENEICQQMISATTTDILLGRLMRWDRCLHFASFLLLCQPATAVHIARSVTTAPSTAATSR